LDAVGLRFLSGEGTSHLADQGTNPNIAALRKLEASLHAEVYVPPRETADDFRQDGHSWRLRGSPIFWRISLMRWWPLVRKIAVVSASIAFVITAGLLVLWWRLSSGPISLDLATPWLTAAIEDNFGKGHTVKVGGTQLERDERGRTALRLIDVVVTDPDGNVVARAPKAEVGVSGAELIAGRLRVERLSLVGAELAVRIEPSGKVTVFAGADKRPFATASISTTPIPGITAANAEPRMTDAPPSLPVAPPPPAASRMGLPDFNALLAWIDGLGASGLDGRDLGEIGFKSGKFVVDDLRNGTQWSFKNLDLSITRSQAGAIVLTVTSENPERPWVLKAALTPTGHRHRIIEIDAQKVPLKDLLLALQVGEGPFQPDLPLTGRVRAEIGPDGTVRAVEGRLLFDKGTVGDANDPDSRFSIERAEVSVEWDSASKTLTVPFQIISEGNRFTLMAHVEAPQGISAPWNFRLTGGTIVLASSRSAPVRPLILNRIAVRLRVDPEAQRVDVVQGDIGNMDIRVAINGGLDYSGAEPKLGLGIAATRMSVAALKQVWPAFTAPRLRNWMLERLTSGTVERVDIATNMALSSLRANGPPIPDDGLSIEIAGRNAEIRPVEGLPPVRDAEVSVHVTGRTFMINIRRGHMEVSPGRRLLVSNAVFEVPDTYLAVPLAQSRFRIDGPVPAVAELLALPRLREASGAPIEAATSKGTTSAQVTVGLPLQAEIPPGAVRYTIAMDVSNFAAERMVMGQKIEAAILKVSATAQGYQIRGDVRINGVPANVDYRKPRGDADADVRLQATLDASARARLGFNMAQYIAGPLPIRLQGKIPVSGRDGRFAVEAELTQLKIENLLPGWVKASGRPARATFNIQQVGDTTKIEDLVIDGSGTSVKGSVELDNAGEIVSVNFPSFALSDGDKASLKAERGTDGVLRVTLRGDVYDGRAFVKSAVSGPTADKTTQQIKNVDLDVKLGIIAGFHGETLRGVDLKLSRRDGVLKAFALNAKLGRDATLIGDMRIRPGTRQQVVFFESGDAGALFRFTDTYAKLFGGRIWVALDPPGPEVLPQLGTLDVTDFVIRGEPALDRVVAGAAPPGAPQRGAEFSRMRVEFTRLPGRLPFARASCADPRSVRRSRARSIMRATTCACAAPLCRSTASTTCSARFRCSAFSSAAAATRGWSA
jgi:hypothetical protein